MFLHAVIARDVNCGASGTANSAFGMQGGASLNHATPTKKFKQLRTKTGLFPHYFFRFCLGEVQQMENALFITLAS